MSEKGINVYGKSENIHLTAEDWNFRWKQNHIGFHLASVDPSLIKYEHVLLGQNNRVFLPLCGKSKDLVYLADKGHDVRGCEFVEKAVKDFFSENGLGYTRMVKTLDTGSINEYKATSKQITIYQGDFFALSSHSVGKFDAIWDRASLTAIHPKRRSEYAKKILDLLSANGKFLTNAFYMTGVQYSGPPYSVSLDDIKEMYEKYCDITLLETKDETGDANHLKVTCKLKHIHLVKFSKQAEILQQEKSTGPKLN